MLIVAASCKLSNSVYRGALALLYIGDILSLAALFAFAFWPVGYKGYVYAAGVFNWAALVAFLIIIPLIVLVHTYLIKNYLIGSFTETPNLMLYAKNWISMFLMCFVIDKSQINC